MLHILQPVTRCGSVGEMEAALWEVRLSHGPSSFRRTRPSPSPFDVIAWLRRLARLSLAPCRGCAASPLFAPHLSTKPPSTLLQSRRCESAIFMPPVASCLAHTSFLILAAPPLPQAVYVALAAAFVTLLAPFCPWYDAATEYSATES
jgi:hypothetical protein